MEKLGYEQVLVLPYHEISSIELKKPPLLAPTIIITAYNRRHVYRIAFGPGTGMSKNEAFENARDLLCSIPQLNQKIVVKS